MVLDVHCHCHASGHQRTGKSPLGPPIERLFFAVVNFSRGTLPTQQVGENALLGDLDLPDPDSSASEACGSFGNSEVASCYGRTSI